MCLLNINAVICFDVPFKELSWMVMMDLHAKPCVDDGGSSRHHFYPIGLPHDFPFLDDQTHIMHLQFLPSYSAILLACSESNCAAKY
jgi:hypothetical protein